MQKKVKLKKVSFKGKVKALKIIVQKFGGTSVSTKEKRKMVIEKVKSAIDLGYNPVVVVSAMGRKGDPYSTDSLLSLINNDVNLNKQGTDLLMCCGELISSVVMSTELINKGIDAIPITGGQAGIITDDNYTKANLLEANGEKILSLISNGKIPVITGFQGMTEGGFFTTLGRGGSDTSAAIIGASLKAERIEIYTDVDGIMTADPRIVQNASVINVLNYDEVFQLADQGAKVIHPRAVEIAKNYNIPLYIKNTMNNSQGTIINSVGDKNSNRLVTSITSCDKRIQVIVKAENNKRNIQYNNILEKIAENNVSLDLINIFPEQQIFTISEEAKERVVSIFNKYNINHKLTSECSNIALIGSGMRGVPGVMAKIYKTLNDNNIEVLQTADSHMTIWCLIHTSNLSKAINALHSAFI